LKAATAAAEAASAAAKAADAVKEVRPYHAREEELERLQLDIFKVTLR